MKSLSVFALAATMMVPAMAANSSAALDDIAAKAATTRAVALEVANELKSKKADLALVNERVKTLDQHTEALNEALNQVDASSFTGAQAQEWERVKALVAVMNIFADRKQQILSESDAARQRNLLRAKALGIAERSDMVKKSLWKIKG